MSTELDQQLAALKQSIASREPPAQVDAAIAAAIANRRRLPRRADSRWRTPAPVWFARFAALAATVAAVAILHKEPASDPAVDFGAPATSESSDKAWFLPVVPMSELAQTDDALVIPARVSRMTLAQFGLPVDPAEVADSVDTELLVRADGAVLAVRFNH